MNKYSTILIYILPSTLILIIVGFFLNTDFNDSEERLEVASSIIDESIEYHEIFISKENSSAYFFKDYLIKEITFFSVLRSKQIKYGIHIAEKCKNDDLNSLEAQMIKPINTVLLDDISQYKYHHAFEMKDTHETLGFLTYIGLIFVVLFIINKSFGKNYKNIIKYYFLFFIVINFMIKVLNTSNMVNFENAFKLCLY
ncbi:hypothetical protein [Psychroflexus planctonicus]|uniref:Uncharacterized protein n=1 Tax=Psychroflexus planctonicus TaxID=1526575 RepID=A0ABQ1SG67_9FLAO|nr:hypothetical protein [Psychroflexus planctonicus]GGE27326.1 hypothetical protein GCM10010832_05050 [Psychroflexus planctonicus]